jgi:glutathione S-transferase
MATMADDRITLYGSFTSSSSYKPMLYLALARLPFSFKTVNLKTGVQKTPDYLAINRYGKVPSLRHRGLTILQSNVILDYLARTTGHFEPASEQDALARARVAGVGERQHHQHRQGAPLQPVPHRRSRRDGVFPAARRGRARLRRPLPRRPRLAGRRAMLDRRHRLLGPHGLHGRGRHRDLDLAAPRSLGATASRRCPASRCPTT